MTKKHQDKYGKLPMKNPESTPWDVLCVDLIGPYKIKQKNKENVILWAVTMIDPATGWFEMKNIPTKRADIISNVIEQTWLTRYPWPTQIIVDRGKEFMKEFISMIKHDYNIKRKVITTRNPQVNSILERVHQTVGNILRTFRMHDSVLDKDNPWDGILPAIMFAIRATVHTVTRMSPM